MYSIRNDTEDSRLPTNDYRKMQSNIKVSVMFPDDTHPPEKRTRSARAG